MPHPIIQSACWYLDFTWDVDKYINNDMLNPFLNLDEVKHHADFSFFYPSKSSTVTRKYHTGSKDKSDSKNLTFRIYNGKILGGEISLWTEKVDYTNIECRVWPRAGVISSMLWGISPREAGSFSESIFKNTSIAIEEINLHLKTKIDFYLKYISFREHLSRRYNVYMAPISMHIPSYDKKLSDRRLFTTKEISYDLKILYSYIEFKAALLDYYASFLGKYVTEPAEDVDKDVDKDVDGFRNALTMLSLKVSCQCPGIVEGLHRFII